MSSRVVRFSGVGGIEVRLDPSVLVLVALVGWVFTSWFREDHPLPVAIAMASVGAILVVVTTFAHELAHALEARHRGIDVVAITLLVVGGVTEMHARGQSARDELAVAAVGPYVSLVCGAVFGIVATFVDLRVPDPFAAPLGDLAGVLGWWNVLLAVFNLVPGAPLDGGRVLRSALWLAFGDRLRALIVSVRLGQLLGVVISGGGLWILSRTLTAWLPATGLVLLGGFMVRGATSELAHARMDAAMDGHTVGSLLAARPEPSPGPAPGSTPPPTPEGVPSLDLAEDLHTLIERFQGPHRVVTLTDGDREVGALTQREAAQALERLRRQHRGRGRRDDREADGHDEDAHRGDPSASTESAPADVGP